MEPIVVIVAALSMLANTGTVISMFAYIAHSLEKDARKYLILLIASGLIAFGLLVTLIIIA